MEISFQRQQGTCNAHLRGQFTFNDHPGFRDVLNNLAQEDVNEVVLHLGGVEFVDSAALGMLLLALDESQKHQKTLVLSGATGQVKKMFDMAKFSSLFHLR